jgi:catechol 2,3-dioxygenase-like lactoylglutathione lyase family enzyme
MMPRIGRMLESALTVADVGRSIRFYSNLFGFPAMTADENFAALNVSGGQVLLLFQEGTTAAAKIRNGEVIPGHDASGVFHLAFGIEKEELPAWVERLQQNGVSIESAVHWERGGESVYFRDPDGHLLELATRGTWPNY